MQVEAERFIFKFKYNHFLRKRLKRDVFSFTAISIAACKSHKLDMFRLAFFRSVYISIFSVLKAINGHLFS